MKTLTALSPVMPASGPVQWPEAVWIGSLRLPCRIGDSVWVRESDGYSRARLLVFRDERPAAFVECNLRQGRIAGDELREKLALLRPTEKAAPSTKDRPTAKMSVVLCTRNRGELLHSALRSVLECRYPDFEVVVVDNASDDDSVSTVVAACRDRRVRLVQEPLAGLAVARNTGAIASSGRLIAFTDDDVVVDPDWLRWLADAASDGAGCVTGLVPSGELRTASQSRFEKRVSWSLNLNRAVFCTADPPPDSPLFPFQAGQYGTGANFAMRREVLFAIGGFDEGLGVGSPAGGGEDLDIFVRTLAAGHSLAYEPAAVVWHRHRWTSDAVQLQARDYGVGLGAWLTSVAASRELRPLAVARALAGGRHLLRLTGRVGDDTPIASVGGRLRELAAVARGPVAYARSRLQGRRPRPLLS